MQHWSEVPEHVPGQIVSPADALAEYDREIKGLEDEKKRRGLNRIETFFPLTGPHRRELYPKHMAFFRAGKYYRARCFSAGNRCLVASSVLEVEFGCDRRVSELIREGNVGQSVHSWDGQSMCWRQASPVFIKGYGPARRLYLSNGQHFDCGDDHHVLAENGAWVPWHVGLDHRLWNGLRIIDTISLGDQVILDISVPGTDCYISQGLVSHNCGKTVTGAYEMAVHLTGLYPRWWEGRVFEETGNYWAAGTSNEKTKEIVQAELLGKLEKDDTVGSEPIGLGTGMIPRDRIASVDFHPQIRGAIKTAWIKHVSGKRNTLVFKSFEQSALAFEGSSVLATWLDESPPLDVYTEALMRSLTTGGLVLITATPLAGLTDLVQQFMPDGVIPDTQIPV